MNNIKKIIIFLAIIIFIIIVILSLILLNQKKEKNTYEIINNSENNNLNITVVEDESEYHDVERIINKYFSYINYLDYDYFQVKLDNSEIQKAKEKYCERGKEFLKDCLVEQYTQKENWEKNILKYIKKKINIIEMNKANYNNINIYLISVNYDKENSNIIVFMDNENETFSILPEEFMNEKITKYNLKEIINNTNINQIEKNDNNAVQRIKLDDEKICLQYYYHYLNLLRNDVDGLYYTLDKKYRENRFENIEDFRAFINNNKEKLEKAVLSNYQVQNKNNYVEYMIIDEDGRYYVFCATSAMKYTLYLDIYTVDLPEFIEKYNKSSDQEKVVLNINKIKTALNNEDYKYVYDKLADSFKNKYFENEESLKEYWLNNLYKRNIVEYEDFRREGNLYTYKLRVIKDYEEGEELPEGKNAPSKKLNIVMQLKEGTDFVMSFSIDE